MRPVHVRIDRMVVELADEQRAAEVEPTLREALALLAARLATAPLGAGQHAPLRALELVELHPVGADWVAGPGAAARIAEELYQQIARAA